MKYILLLSILWFCSCSDNEVNYTYTFKVKVTYLNGDTDTTIAQVDSHDGLKCYIYLSVSDGGLLSSGGPQPCLIKGCGLSREAVSCGVRKFDILGTEKILLVTLK